MMKLSLYGLALASCVTAIVPSPPPAPTITAAPLEPRQYIKTLGWFQTKENGSTIWEPWTYDRDKTTYSTSSTWFRRCPEDDDCNLYTSCSSGYLMGQGTSSFCGNGGGTTKFCSNHILYYSSGAPKPYFWYWCDKAPLVGSVFYEQRPSVPASAIPSTTATSPDAQTTTSSPPTSTTTPPPPSSSPSSNTGAIVGGVVGGIGGLALIGAALFLLLRRRRSHNNLPRSPSEAELKGEFIHPPPATEWVPVQQHDVVEAPANEAAYAGPQHSPGFYAPVVTGGAMGKQQGMPMYTNQHGTSQYANQQGMSQYAGHSGPVFGGEMSAEMSPTRGGRRFEER